jgi:hypothetical protein
VKTLFALAFVAATVAAPVGDVSFTIEHGPGVVAFSVEGPTTPYLAGVLLSMSSALAHYFHGLPPLLADHVLAGAGAVEQGSYELSVPEVLLPPGCPIYAQGVTFDGVAVRASAVDSFVLDASGGF